MLKIAFVLRGGLRRHPETIMALYNRINDLKWAKRDDVEVKFFAHTWTTDDAGNTLDEEYIKDVFGVFGDSLHSLKLGGERELVDTLREIFNININDPHIDQLYDVFKNYYEDPSELELFPLSMVFPKLAKKDHTMHMGKWLIKSKERVQQHYGFVLAVQNLIESDFEPDVVFVVRNDCVFDIDFWNTIGFAGKKDLKRNKEILVSNARVSNFHNCQRDTWHLMHYETCRDLFGSKTAREFIIDAFTGQHAAHLVMTPLGDKGKHNYWPEHLFVHILFNQGVVSQMYNSPVNHCHIIRDGDILTQRIAETRRPLRAILDSQISEFVLEDMKNGTFTKDDLGKAGEGGLYIDEYNDLVAKLDSLPPYL